MTLVFLHCTKYFQNIAWPHCLLLEDVCPSQEHLASSIYKICMCLYRNGLPCFSPPGNNILIVAHASSLEACTCQLQGLSPQNSKDFVQMVRKVIPSCVSGTCGPNSFRTVQWSAGSWILWSTSLLWARKMHLLIQWTKMYWVVLCLRHFIRPCVRDEDMFELVLVSKSRNLWSS